MWISELWSRAVVLGRKGLGASRIVPSSLDGSPDPVLRDEAVALLRQWLPRSAIQTYREMILADPDHWHEDPHFASGFVVKHLLRGNGITEEALGVRSLEPLWPELLTAAVLSPEDVSEVRQSRLSSGG